jgi:hypothetical protein
MVETGLSHSPQAARLVAARVTVNGFDPTLLAFVYRWKVVPSTCVNYRAKRLVETRRIGFERMLFDEARKQLRITSHVF